MDSPKVDIDFKLMEIAFAKHVRDKAIAAGSTIVYVLKDNLIEEDPETGEITIIKTYGLDDDAV